MRLDVYSVPLRKNARKREKYRGGIACARETLQLPDFSEIEFSVRNKKIKAKGWQMKNYANAKEVLPDELLREVRKHHTGFLWVPKDNRGAESKKLVMALHRQGADRKKISQVSGFSVRRVGQIIRECQIKESEEV
jgi:hypothetical protein